MLVGAAAAEELKLVGGLRLVAAAGDAGAPLHFTPPSEEIRLLLSQVSPSTVEVVVSDEGPSIAAAVAHLRGLFPAEGEAQLGNFNTKLLSGTSDVLFRAERACPRIAQNRLDPSAYTLTTAEQEMVDQLGVLSGSDVAGELRRVQEAGGDKTRTALAAAARASIAFNINAHFGESRGLSAKYSGRGRLTRVTSFTPQDAMRYSAFRLLDFILTHIEGLPTAKTPFTLLAGDSARMHEILALFMMTSPDCIAENHAVEQILCRFFPTPGATLDVELLHRGATPLVRVFYNGEPVSLCPSDAVLCPLEEFTVSVDETIKADFRHFCLTGEKLIINGGRRSRRKVSWVILVAGLALLAGAFWRRWPELSGRRPEWQVTDRHLHPKAD